MAPRKTKRPTRKPKKMASAVVRSFNNAQLNALHALDDYSERPIDAPIPNVLQEARALELLVNKYGKKLRTGTRLDFRTMTSLAARRDLLETAEATWLTEHLALASRKVKKARSEG